MKIGTLGTFAVKRTQLSLARLAKQLRRASEQPQDAEAIHDLRVSIRRYLQCLRLFQDLFDESIAKTIRKRLRQLMKLLGKTRNCDIAIELLLLAELPKTHSLVAHLRERRDEAQHKLLKQLTKKRWKNFASNSRLQLRTRKGVAGPWRIDMDVASNASAFLPQMCDEFFSAGSAAIEAKEDYKLLHQFRLRGKRLRYTLELFRNCYSRGMEQRLRQLRGLQDKLGEINDCLSTMELIARDAVAVRQVQSILAQRDRALTHHWQQHFPPGTREKWNRWLSRPIPAVTEFCNG
ncbi:MAG: CHAD domain-containing protein [Bryobacteraceae bacterium]